jgi:mRNA interferase MazF
MGMEVNRFDVVLVTLDPTKGSEIKKTRPCLVISPNEMNHNISTLIVAPMTSKGKRYPTRVDIVFQEIKGQIVLDQIRSIDKSRVIKKLGHVSKKAQENTLSILSEMFSL